MMKVAAGIAIIAIAVIVVGTLANDCAIDAYTGAAIGAGASFVIASLLAAGHEADRR
jgi:hypothetical protein